MNQILPLLRREWLQHRFGWTLILLVPTALAVLGVSFGQIQFDAEETTDKLPAALTLGALGISMGVHLVMMWVTSLIIVTGLARRDHADRSVEFWLSLPVGHAKSLAVPLLTHLLLAPVVALLAGLVGGALVSLVMVARVSGAGAWFALPWATLLAAGLALVARLSLGLVLATVWLSPLVLLGVLLTAWFKRWGLVILAVGLGLGSVILERVFGQPLLSDLFTELLGRAGRSVTITNEGHFVIETFDDIQDLLSEVPRWAMVDASQALGLLATPLLAGVLLASAACFFMLVRWRQAGAGAAG